MKGNDASILRDRQTKDLLSSDNNDCGDLDDDDKAAY